MLRTPKTLGLSQSTKPIPSNKKVVYIYCGAPVCNLLAQGTQRAGQVLGWQYQTIPSTGTPQSIQQAWETAARMHPDAVIASGFNTSAYASALGQLKAMHVFVGNLSTTDPGPTGGVDMRMGDVANTGEEGDMMATFIAKDSGRKANTLYVNVPAYTILQGVATHFHDTYSKYCPGCQVADMQMPITALGSSAAPEQVVSYLRAHPSVNYVAFSLDAAELGLPAALRAAGLAGKVKFVGGSPTVENLNYVQQGEEAGTVNQGFYEEMAMLVDGAARYVSGQSLAPDLKLQVPYWF